MKEIIITSINHIPKKMNDQQKKQLKKLKLKNEMEITKLSREKFIERFMKKAPPEEIKAILAKSSK